MNLVIAEKPSVARSIAAVIEATDRQGGYLQGGYLVSWCIGQLVSFADAGMYNERFKKWGLAHHPGELAADRPPDTWERLDSLRALLHSAVPSP